MFLLHDDFVCIFLNRHWRYEVHILWRPSLAQRLLCLLILPWLFGWQRLHYRRWRHHFSWTILVLSGQMMSSVSVIKPLSIKEPRQNERTKPLLCQSRLQRTRILKLLSWHKYILPIIFEKKLKFSILIDNVSFAWWFCVYFLNRHRRNEVHILWRPSLAQRLLYLLILQRLFGWQRLHYRRWRHHLSWMCQEKTYGRYSWAIKSGRKVLLHTYIIFWSWNNNDRFYQKINFFV